MGGMLLSGCSTGEGEPNVIQAAEAEDKPQEVTEVESRLDFLKKQTVQHAEYLSLEEFVNNIADEMKEGSEQRMKNAMPEYTLAVATVHYVNYFEDEITAKGMNADFDELQLLADDVVEGVDGEDFEEHVKAFEDKLHDINVKMVEESRFADIQSWVSASVELLPNQSTRMTKMEKKPHGGHIKSRTVSRFK